MDLKTLHRIPHLIDEFLWVHRLIKFTTVKTVEEFTVLQIPPSTLREWRGLFLMIPIISKDAKPK